MNRVIWMPKISGSGIFNWNVGPVHPGKLQGLLVEHVFQGIRTMPRHVGSHLKGGSGRSSRHSSGRTRNQFVSLGGSLRRNQRHHSDAGPSIPARFPRWLRQRGGQPDHVQHPDRQPQKRPDDRHPGTRAPPPVEAITDQGRQGELHPDGGDSSTPVASRWRLKTGCPFLHSRPSPVFPHSPSNREESSQLGGHAARGGLRKVGKSWKRGMARGRDLRTRLFYPGPIPTVNSPATRIREIFHKVIGRGPPGRRRQSASVRDSPAKASVFEQPMRNRN